MDPLFGDNNREVQEILERGAEGIRDDDDGESAVPLALCTRLCPTLDWELMTGFPHEVLQLILERAAPMVARGGKSRFKNNESVMLALVWFRSGSNVKMIAARSGFNYQVCLRALFKGIKALAACFEPFKVYGNAPPLRVMLRPEDRAGIPERALDSLFIVDGKHIEGKRIGSFEDAGTYWSYKLNSLAYQFQCVVTHLGHCVYVSNAERAATHDMMVYRNNRIQLLSGLSAGGFKNPIILADQGYKCELPELFVPDTPNKMLNGRRLVVENYFGRMTNVFRIVRAKFPFGYEIVNPFLKALCFLTNVHVRTKPLRAEEYKLHRAFITMRKNKQMEKRRRKSAQHAREEGRINDSNLSPSSVSSSPSSQSIYDALNSLLSKRTPPPTQDDE